MAVDRGYGSGKPLSAAQSRNRRRAAEGKMTKGKKGGITSAQFKAMQSKQAASPLGQAADLAMSFLPIGRAKSIASSLAKAGQAKKAASLLTRSASAQRGRGVRDLISEARYIDDISRDALGPRDFGRASGQAGRYYEDALSNIRAAQKTRNNPSLVKTFPKVNPPKKITQKNLRVGTKPTQSTRIIKVLKGGR